MKMSWFVLSCMSRNPSFHPDTYIMHILNIEFLEPQTSPPHTYVKMVPEK